MEVDVTAVDVHVGDARLAWIMPDDPILLTLNTGLLGSCGSLPVNLALSRAANSRLRGIAPFGVVSSSRPQPSSRVRRPGRGRWWGEPGTDPLFDLGGLDQRIPDQDPE
jgi:hypothetical protein